jgi:uncharacterized protein YkwD
MRFSVRFLLSAATGGLLLTLPASHVTVHAETTEPAPAVPAPTAPAPAPVGEKQEPQAPAPEEKKEPAPAPVPAAPLPAPTETPKPVEPPKPVEAPAPVEPPLKPAEPVIPSAPEKVGPPYIAPKPQTPLAKAPSATSEEMQFVQLVNQERMKRGLSRLVVDPLLIQVARDHSAEMRDKAYFNHESPTSGIKTPLDRYLKAVSHRPGYACVGENLFWATVIDVRRGHQAFMTSPTHRENVLFPRFEKIGVGIVKQPNGEFWVTQMFLTNTDPVSVAKNKMSKR